MPKLQVLQPRYFERFGCIGAECEDTCCEGWGVAVDRETYDKYQVAGIGPIAGHPLSQLVEINPAGSSPRNYAKMRLTGVRCSALHEGWCGIQQALGEAWIPDMCSTFPRVLNVTQGVLEQSLNLACPEAARLVLCDPDAMRMLERSEDGTLFRSGSISLAGDVPDAERVRGLMIQTILERSRPLWQRLASLGMAIGEMGRAEARPAAGILEEQLASLREGRLDEALCGLAVPPAAQLEAVLELVVARIGQEYTSPRFLECYSEFMRGLGWTDQSTMEGLANRYRHAMQRYFLPFVRNHEHLFENYLVNYMFRTAFPYGRKQPDGRLALDAAWESMRNSYLLMAAQYAIIRTVLIGMAGFQEHNLHIDHVVKLVQSCSKAFQHSETFAAVILKHLAPHAEDPARACALLVAD